MVGQRITARHNVDSSGRILVGEVVREGSYQNVAEFSRVFRLSLGLKIEGQNPKD